MRTFYTSDTHFDDEYANQYFNRPFKSVEEMNVVMVERWNNVAAENETVYHLFRAAQSHTDAGLFSTLWSVPVKRVRTDQSHTGAGLKGVETSIFHQ